MTEHSAFDTLLQPHLNRVSRSFAVCIAQLHEPLRSWTGLAYLICRLLDTVEDAPWAEASAQDHAFVCLQQFLATEPSPEAAQAFAARFPAALPEGEALLLRDCCQVVRALHALPPGPKQAVADVAQRMAQGMRHYARTWAQEDSLRLIDLEDVNRYCYFVAGVVGELLTRLFALAHPTFQPTEDTWRNAQHFGLFLQKVNLLKDQSKDELERRFLCPSRPALVQSLRLHAEGALGYVTALPDDARAFRIFCAWSLALGAASLPFIQADHASRGTAPHAIKIGRDQARALMDEVAAIATDNQALERAMHAAMQLWPDPDSGAVALPPEPSAQATATARRTWFVALGHGPLRRADLAALGMAPAQA